MNASADTPTSRRLFFFLSHAHRGGLSAASLNRDVDVWVDKVFQDLWQAVDQCPDRGVGWDIGVMRPCTDQALDLNDRIALALANAAVFVMLCSEVYRTDLEVRRQREMFDQRASAGRSGEILPVLWCRTPGPLKGDLAAAAALAPRARAYQDLGLLPLCRLRDHESAYQQLLNLLAEWIVAVADGRPPPHVPTSVLQPQSHTRPFVSALLAPTKPTELAEPDGPDRVADVVARLVAPELFVPETLDFTASRLEFPRSPGLLLIDVWYADTPAGFARLYEALRDLRRWVVPVVISFPDDRSPDRLPTATDKVIEVVDTLVTSRRRQPSTTHVVRHLDYCDNILATAIAEAAALFEVRNPGISTDRRFEPRRRIMDATSEAEEP